MTMRSVKSIVFLMITLIAILSGFAILTIIFGNWVNKAEYRYHDIITLEKDFSSIIVQEGILARSPGPLDKVTNKYNELLSTLETMGFSKEKSLIYKRHKTFEQFLTVKKAIAKRHSDIQLLIPDMVESVRYIGDHHIAYMKNLLRRGHYIQDWDVTAEFKRSHMKSAPELEIISEAITIQNRLLDVFSLFYELQTNEAPSSIRNNFQKQIDLFYQAVNRFEDYSLDAQDGLLVEELLIIGRNFEDNYTKLLTGESELNLLAKKLEGNNTEVLQNFAFERVKIETNKVRLKTALLVIQSMTLIALGFMVIFFMYYGRKIMKAFERTVEETKRIQNDLSYEISFQPDDYVEFQVVYRTLNGMSRTIRGQIEDLENARAELELRVIERTAELLDANTKLRSEINERITGEAKRAELEARLMRAQKMEALGMLAGGVAHDLNNILSGVVSYPELILLRLPKDSPYRRKIERIKESGEKAAMVVQDLLTMARRSVAATEVLNLNDVVNSYLESPEFKKWSSEYPDIKVYCELDHELLNVNGSPFHLSKVIMNLVSNAFEAMPSGGQITIRTKNKYVDFSLPKYDNIEEGDYTVLEIMDEGTGISHEDTARIFEPFYTRKVMGRSGSGLGMAVVWGTVKDHNGYIDINSIVNKGTTFSLYFPASRSMTVDEEDSVAIQDIRGHGEHILVVDDVAEQRDIAADMLSELGYEVDTADSGENALIYLHSKSSDLIILDMIMEPGMDGLETYQHILQFSPKQRAIIASGYSDMDKVKRARELGVTVYLRKPYTLIKLGQAVLYALNNEVGRCENTLNG